MFFCNSPHQAGPNCYLGSLYVYLINRNSTVPSYIFINKNKDINDIYSLGLMWGLNELRYTKQLELCPWDKCWWVFLYYDNETLPNDDHTCHVLSFCLALWMPHLPKCFQERSPKLNEGGKPVSIDWVIFELFSLLVYLNDAFLPSVASPRGWTRDCNEPHAPFDSYSRFTKRCSSDILCAVHAAIFMEGSAACPWETAAVKTNEYNVWAEWVFAAANLGVKPGNMSLKINKTEYSLNNGAGN